MRHLLQAGSAVVFASLLLGCHTSPSKPISKHLATYARERFYRQHPGEKPLNWKIAAAAEEFHRTQPMGKFVLAVDPGKEGNDCSDFVQCAVDEGLGYKARFKRHSSQHLADEDRLFDAYYWDHKAPVQPGDILSVAHSPWYEPYEGATWHVGVVGTDGMVYDFEKLKRWDKPRYGRHSLAWFVRHSLGDEEVLVRRLRAEYRYMLREVPRAN